MDQSIETLLDTIEIMLDERFDMEFSPRDMLKIGVQLAPTLVLFASDFTDGDPELQPGNKELLREAIDDLEIDL